MEFEIILDCNESYTRVATVTAEEKEQLQADIQSGLGFSDLLNTAINPYPPPEATPSQAESSLSLSAIAPASSKFGSQNEIPPSQDANSAERQSPQRMVQGMSEQQSDALKDSVDTISNDHLKASEASQPISDNQRSRSNEAPILSEQRSPQGRLQNAVFPKPDPLSVTQYYRYAVLGATSHDSTGCGDNFFAARFRTFQYKK